MPGGAVPARYRAYFDTRSDQRGIEWYVTGTMQDLQGFLTGKLDLPRESVAAKLSIEAEASSSSYTELPLLDQTQNFGSCSRLPTCVVHQRPRQNGTSTVKPMPAQRCQAKRRDGRKCQANAIDGAHCMFHSEAAEHVASQARGRRVRRHARAHCGEEVALTRIRV